MTDAFPIEGWAAIYEDADLNGDVILPGAFAKSIRLTGAAGVKLLYQHDMAEPVGRWLSFEERAQGLYARGEIILATQRAQEAANLIAAGVLDGLSIGFRTVKARKRERRLIETADLWEVSIVTFPMAPKARIVRADGAEPTLTAFAETIRKAAKVLSV
jgi:hypothetical protein